MGLRTVLEPAHHPGLGARLPGRATTFRDYRRTQRHGVGLGRMVRALGPRFTVLARAHHSYPADLSDEACARLVDVSDHPRIEALCLAGDALVTDCSSLVFDCAVLDRPTVVYAEDWEAFEASRGTYFDLRAAPPGVVARSEDELIDIFATGRWKGSRAAELRAAFPSRFCSCDDGHAAERVVRHVFLGETAGLPSIVPLRDRTPVPAPQAAGRLPEQSQGLPALFPTTPT